MIAELHDLEESLKDFLAEAQNDSYNSKSANFYKYNNLKVFMDPKKDKTPHFIVRIGISEAMYSIESGDKISGGLGSDERLIRRWIDKVFVKAGLSSAWLKSTKIKPVSMRNSEDDDDFSN